MSAPVESLGKAIRSARIPSVWVGILVGTLGVLSLFNNLIRAGSGDVLWADDFDSRLIYWILNWGYHVLFEQRHPLGFWNANSFYPNNLTLAYSDSLLSAQLLFAPLRMLGLPPLACLYLTLAGLCVIGTMLTYYALGRIGGFSFAERALIAFSAHFSLSITSFLVHYQLFGFQLAPSFFLFLYIYLRDFELKHLLFALVLYAAGITFAMYLAPMLFVLSALMTLPVAIRQIKTRGVAQVLRRIGVRGLIITATIALTLYFVQFRPYLQVNQEFPKQSFEETSIYSADLNSLFTGVSGFSYWYGTLGYSTYGAWEYAFFPGYALLTFGLLYFPLLATARMRRSDSAAEASPHAGALGESPSSINKGIDTDLILCLVILFLASLVLSWGPLYKLDHSVKFPFYYLAGLIPGLDNIRAPGRFGMFVGLPLGVFSVAFLRLISVPGRRRVLLPILALILIGVESFPKFPVTPFSVDRDGVYKQVSQAIRPGTPLLELPVQGKDHFETIKVAMEQMDGSTIHWGRMVVGYGSKTTPQYQELVHLDGLVTKGATEPTQILEFGRRLGISDYLIRLNRYPLPMAEEWLKASHEIGTRIVYEDANTILFELAGTSQ